MFENENHYRVFTNFRYLPKLKKNHIALFHIFAKMKLSLETHFLLLNTNNSNIYNCQIIDMTVKKLTRLTFDLNPWL
jgi:hypothetical protein